MRQSGPIVVGVDGSHASVQAVEWAAREALLWQVPVLLLAVVAADPGTGQVAEAVRRRGDECLDAAEQVVRRNDGSLRVLRELRPGAAARELIDESASARLLVLGTRGLGETGAGLDFGSTAETAIAHSSCPVVLVRGPYAESAAAEVVVGVDAARVSSAALGWAFREASLRGVPLLAVHTWREVGEELLGEQAVEETLESAAHRVLAECVADWQGHFPEVEVRRAVEHDRPVRALLRHAEKAGLLVIGSRGRGGFTGMLIGSTSRALAHCAPCPLLVVRPTVEA